MRFPAFARGARYPPRRRGAESYIYHAKPFGASAAKPFGASAAGTAPARESRIDFGDGEAVLVSMRSQSEFDKILMSVGAAGLRRRAANGLPTYDAPLLTLIDDVDGELQYLTWPCRREESRR